MTKILIVNSAEPGITEFTQPLKAIVEETGSIPVVIEYKDSNSINLNDYLGALISGSPQGDDIVEHHKPYFEWIKSYEKPVFGICAGHHVTGAIYGANLLRSEEPESGNFNVSLLKQDPILRGLPTTFKVKQMHNDSITVPKNFELLATSETCKNQLMKHCNKPLYTSQFHPEYYNHDLIKNFISICVQKSHPANC